MFRRQRMFDFGDGAPDDGEGAKGRIAARRSLEKNCDWPSAGPKRTFLATVCRTVQRVSSMSFSEAVRADRDERIEEAARLYEEVLQNSDAGLEPMLNLIVLYWESSSMGFYAAHHLPDAFVDQANRRYRELIPQALRKFPEEPALSFWARYIACIDEGMEFSDNDALAMRNKHTDCLEPEILILQDGQTSPAAQTLLDRCRMEGTVRAKYVAAVLEGIMKRRPPAKDS